MAKPGPKPKDPSDVLSVQVMFRLTPSEAVVLRTAAESNETTVSELVRSTMLDVAQHILTEG